MSQPLWICHHCEERIQSTRDRDGRLYVNRSRANHDRHQRWTVTHWFCEPIGRSKTIEYTISDLETNESVWRLYEKLIRTPLDRTTNLQETFHAALRINERNQ